MKLFGKWRNEDSPEKETAAPPVVPTASVPTGKNIGQGRKILVVDDNPVILKSFDLKLKSVGFKVLTAGDGAGAVSAARQERPVLIVLDINFPPEVGSTGLQWDGFNIMEWMGRFKEVADIPVIIITSGDSPKLKERALATGAVAFFQKPINHDEFLEVVQKVLKESTPVAAEAVGGNG